MSGALSLSAWLAQVDGRPVGSGECVALADSYATQVVGSPVISAAGGSHNEYASSMWEAFDANGTGAFYRKVSPWLPAAAGDVAIWAYGSAVAPSSHVAIVLADLGPLVLVESQNTNGHRYAEKLTLPKAGLLGYIRPLDAPQVTGANPTLASDIIRNPLTAGAAVAQAWDPALAWLTDSKNWQRIGLALLGIILIMIALIKILAPTGLPSQAASLLTKAAPHG